MAGWRLLQLGAKPFEGLGRLHIAGFFAVEVGARALFVVNVQGILEGRWMAEQRHEQVRHGQVVHMGLAYRGEVAAGSEVVVDVAGAHMAEALEVPVGRLSLILVEGRRRHMEARPR